jgi:sugar fermentation stimulation protein A
VSSGAVAAATNLRRSSGRVTDRVDIPLDASLQGHLIRRYKRFLADVETQDGRTVTVHCPNPGRMLGLDSPGSAVRCSTSDDPRRRLRHTLEMIRVGRIWVGLHTLRANRLAARILRAGTIRSLAGYREIGSEVRIGGGSRLDFLLDDHPRGRLPAYVEVKSVTLAKGRRARFPDSVTARGRRHMDALAGLRARGHRAAVLFVVQRSDCDQVEPADDIDPEYGAALRRAADSGVELFAVGARVLARSIRMERVLPVIL